HCGDAGKWLWLCDVAPSHGRVARADERPRQRLRQRRLARGRAAAFDPRQGRPHRRGARWRTHRSMPRRHADRSAPQPWAHQNGPIGEGRIIDGCVACPWHGYQYRLEDGCAPPPFTEKLVTYRVRIARGMVEVDPRPLAPGTSAAMRYE